MRAIWTMVGKDFRQRMRDKSVLIFSFAVPMALMTVLNFVIPTGVDDMDLEPVTLAVSVAADDELANVVVTALSELDAVAVTTLPVADPLAAVQDGEASAGLVIAPGLTQALQSGAEHKVQMVSGDDSGLSTNVVIVVTEQILTELRARSVTGMAALEAGLSADVANQLGQDELPEVGAVTAEPGAASDEQLSASGSLIAGQAGLFLMFTVGFGVLSLLAEKEAGTLARLRSMPIRPWSIVLSKALGGFILGIVATSVLLTAGGLLFGVSFGSIPAVAVLVLCAVLAATSLTFIVTRVARSAEQANTMQTILALVLGMSGGAFVPIAAHGILGKILDVNPISAFTQGLGITAGGGGVADLGGQVLILLGFAAACLLISRLIPDRGVAA